MFSRHEHPGVPGDLHHLKTSFDKSRCFRRHLLTPSLHRSTHESEPRRVTATEADQSKSSRGRGTVHDTERERDRE